MHENIKQRIRLDEAVKLKPYKCIAEKLTIGIGRNLTDRGISPEEAEFLFENDLELAEKESIAWLGFNCWTILNEQRRGVVINMMFNLGAPRLAKFKKFKAALLAYDYQEAAVEMLDSKWARQVGERSQRLAEMMRSGFWLNNHNKY